MTLSITKLRIMPVNKLAFIVETRSIVSLNINKLESHGQQSLKASKLES
jgi:hypothetical protein